MAAITPTVQRVTHGIRQIAKSLLKNRKNKKHASSAAPAQTEDSAPQASPSIAKANASRHTASVSAKKAKPTAKKSAKPAQGKKAKTLKNSNVTSTRKNLAVIPETDTDPAHQRGHRKMNLKSEFKEKTGPKGKPQDSSALNHMSKADIIMRNESTHRRLINGPGTMGSKVPQGRSRKAHS